MLVPERISKDVTALIEKGKEAQAKYIEENREGMPIELASKIYKQMLKTPKMNILDHPELLPEGLSVENIVSVTNDLVVLETAIGIASARFSQTCIKNNPGKASTIESRGISSDMDYVSSVKKPGVVMETIQSRIRAIEQGHPNRFVADAYTEEEQTRRDNSVLRYVGSRLNDGETVSVEDGSLVETPDVWITKETGSTRFFSADNRLIFNIMATVISD